MTTFGAVSWRVPPAFSFTSTVRASMNDASPKKATRALATIVLVGVQPVLMQVPPTCSRSINATFQPARASSSVSGLPAWPAPMTMASKLSAVMGFSLCHAIFCFDSYTCNTTPSSGSTGRVQGACAITSFASA